MELIGDAIELIVHELFKEPFEFGHDQVHTVLMVFDGKTDLCLGHVQPIGANLTVEAKMPRCTFAAIIGVGKAEHGQDGILTMPNGKLGTIGQDKVHTETPVRAVDGATAVLMTLVSAFLKNSSFGICP